MSTYQSMINDKNNHLKEIIECKQKKSFFHKLIIVKGKLLVLISIQLIIKLTNQIHIN